MAKIVVVTCVVALLSNSLVLSQTYQERGYNCCDQQPVCCPSTSIIQPLPGYPYPGPEPILGNQQLPVGGCQPCDTFGVPSSASNRPVQGIPAPYPFPNPSHTYCPPCHPLQPINNIPCAPCYPLPPPLNPPSQFQPPPSSPSPPSPIQPPPSPPNPPSPNQPVIPPVPFYPTQTIQQPINYPWSTFPRYPYNCPPCDNTQCPPCYNVPTYTYPPNFVTQPTPPPPPQPAVPTLPPPTQSPIPVPPAERTFPPPPQPPQPPVPPRPPRPPRPYPTLPALPPQPVQPQYPCQPECYGFVLCCTGFMPSPYRYGSNYQYGTPNG